MEAVLVALMGKRPEEIMPEDYLAMLDALNFTPEWSTYRPVPVVKVQ